MTYSLVIVTHGDNRQIQKVIDRAWVMLTPAPSEVWLFEDGPVTTHPATPHGWPDRDGWPGWRSSRNVGFCETYARAWLLVGRFAAEPYVFWLEHDFLIERPVSIGAAAALLRKDVVQVSLERQAVNERELAAGGLVRSFDPDHDDDVWWHRAYFTTNPSLMRRTFIRDHPWPDGTRECEGHMGRRLIEQGYRFATLRTPDRSPYVTHIGQRTGKGY